MSQDFDADDIALNLDHFCYNLVHFYFGFISLLGTTSNMCHLSHLFLTLSDNRQFLCLLLDHDFKKHYSTIVLAITFMLCFKVDEIVLMTTSTTFIHDFLQY